MRRLLIVSSQSNVSLGGEREKKGGRGQGLQLLSKNGIRKKKIEKEGLR